MKTVFVWLIILVGISAVCTGVALIFSPDSGGFMSGIQYVFALIVFATANVLIWVMNLLYWRMYGASLRLRIIVAIQSIPAFVTLFILGHFLYSNWQDDRAINQHVALNEVIKSDAASRLLLAQHGCGKMCEINYPLNEQLLDAADAGALKVAQLLVAQHAAVSSEAGEETLDLRTCEGLYLPGRDGLDVAVARHDTAMMNLLFAVSDAQSRRSALWLAAKLDDLDLVENLAAKGVPLSIRGEVLDENDTLLVAAASGAATRVGKWLNEVQHMPVDAITNGQGLYFPTAPISALMGFQSDAPGSPRTLKFLSMLVAHGADIDALDDRHETSLQKAVHDQNKRAAQMLLNAGANAGFLSAAQRLALNKLLAQPDDPPQVADPQAGCVKP